MTSRALTLLAMAAGAASSRLGAKWRPEQCAALADAALLDDADDEHAVARCDLADLRQTPPGRAENEKPAPTVRKPTV